MRWLPVRSPLFTAAVAVTSLKVEPGAYWPWIARFENGSVVSSVPFSSA